MIYDSFHFVLILLFTLLFLESWVTSQNCLLYSLPFFCIFIYTHIFTDQFGLHTYSHSTVLQGGPGFPLAGFSPWTGRSILTSAPGKTFALTLTPFHMVGHLWCQHLSNMGILSFINKFLKKTLFFFSSTQGPHFSDSLFSQAPDDWTGIHECVRLHRCQDILCRDVLCIFLWNYNIL